jgi:hypothetical protein
MRVNSPACGAAAGNGAGLGCASGGSGAAGVFSNIRVNSPAGAAPGNGAGLAAACCPGMAAGVASDDRFGLPPAWNMRVNSPAAGAAGAIGADAGDGTAGALRGIGIRIVCVTDMSGESCRGRVSSGAGGVAVGAAGGDWDA